MNTITSSSPLVTDDTMTSSLMVSSIPMVTSPSPSPMVQESAILLPSEIPLDSSSSNVPVSFAIKLKCPSRDEIRRIRLVRNANESLFETLCQQTGELMMQGGMSFHYLDEAGNKLKIENENDLLRVLQSNPFSMLTLIVGDDGMQKEMSQRLLGDNRPHGTIIHHEEKDSSSTISLSPPGPTPSFVGQKRKGKWHRGRKQWICKEKNVKMHEKKHERMEKKKKKLEGKIGKMQRKETKRKQKMDGKRKAQLEKQILKHFSKMNLDNESPDPLLSHSLSSSSQQLHPNNSSQCFCSPLGDCFCLQCIDKKRRKLHYSRRRVENIRWMLTHLEKRKGKLANKMQLMEKEGNVEKWQIKTQKIEKKQQKLLSRQEFWILKQQELSNQVCCYQCYPPTHFQPQPHQSQQCQPQLHHCSPVGGGEGTCSSV